MTSSYDVPKRWFLHFYIVGVVVNFVLLSFILLGWFPQPVYSLLHLLHMPNRIPEVDVLPVLLVLVMELIQVVRRAYECLYVHVFSNSNMSIVHYVIGLLFYAMFGVCMLSAVDYKHLTVTTEHTSAHDVAHYILGFTIFTIASVCQHGSFQTLASLRKSSSGQVENTKHLIPSGGLFEYVCCPHFFTEIIIYLAMNIVLGFEHQTAVAYLIFVIVNQSIMSWMSHRWYRENFSSYPPKRAAVIPFIF
ncbi:polyprenol reductase-like [Gigantopelta aegis]|uniref:polyprenol reductase-like n=1 Tax=Gigantopelta aegis TaxID=1735272 RepID=UPI001B88A2D6|nr:polyprenol reductase-like [Gigantopelta aegis]